MTTRLKRLSILAAAAAGILSGASARATDYYWDPGDTGGSGGSGTWSTSSSNWETAAGTGNNSAWPGSGSHTATFGGAAGTVTVSGIVSGANQLTFNTSGYVLTGGTVRFIADPGNFVVNQDAKIESLIDDGPGTAYGLAKSGNGTLWLTGANTFGGGNAKITVSAGTLRVDADAALGNTSTAIDLLGGTLRISTGFSMPNTRAIGVSGSTGTISVDANQTFITQGTGRITADTSGTLVKAGSGVWSIGGTSNDAFDGILRVDTGTFEMQGGAKRVGDATNRATVQLNGGTLKIVNTTNSAGTHENNLSVSANSSILFDRSAAGAQGVINTMSAGTFTIGAHTLNVSTGDNAGSGTAGLILGATTLTGNATFNIANGTSASTQIALGAVDDGGSGYSITKQGSGKLTLNSAGTYSGTTKVEGGTLELKDTVAIQNSTLDVSGGGSVSFGVSGTNTYTLGGVKGAGSLNAGSNSLTVKSFAPGNNAIGTVSLTAAGVSVANNATYAFEIGGTTASPVADLVNITGALTLGSGNSYTLNVTNLASQALNPHGMTFVLFDAASAINNIGTWTINKPVGWASADIMVNPNDSSQLVLTNIVVPEPASAAAVMTGLATFGLLRRRRPQRQD